ncbi:MAG: helix-turn-helix domain-containing protein [Rubritepida sp.]|nr:helix-turn-helix domain-containing protein [Rubritepida sp.]
MTAESPALVAIEGARALYRGPALGLAPHRNAAATLALALDAPLTLRLAGPSRELGAPRAMGATLIPPGRRHHLLASGEIVFLYLDALSDDLPRLATADLEGLRAGLLAQPRARLRGWGVREWRAALGIRNAPPPDPRVAAVAAQIDAAPDAFARLADAARAAGLSPSRFQALFRAALGVPFRRYRLWRRLAHAIALAGAGADLTRAAMEAGFASSAHFSAQFRAMFGLAPSRLLALGPWVRVAAPEGAAALVIGAAQAPAPAPPPPRRTAP